MNAENNIGSTIKQLRKKHGLSAKQLCEGLCPPSKLSKIEAGDEYPKEMLLNALMERMGEVPPIKCIPLTELDYKRAAIKKQLSEKFNNNDFDIAEQLQALKNEERQMTNLERQEFLYYQAVYINDKLKQPERSLDKSLQAMHITFSSFNINGNISDHLFTKCELGIVDHIAIILYQTSRIETAIALLSQIEQYYSSHLMKYKVYAKPYSNIVCNLAGWIGETGKLEESLKISQRGLDFCKKNNTLFAFPNLLYTHGYTLCQLGYTDEGKKHIKQSINALIIMNKTYILPEIERDITDSFGKQCWEEIKMQIF